MQFSLKWLLAAAAYAAIGCASVMYASLAWTAALSLVSFGLLVAAAVGAGLGSGRLRGACIGCLIAGLLVRFAVYGHWGAASDVQTSVDRAAQAVAERLPAAASQSASKRIAPFDLLNVFAAGTQTPGDIAGGYQVQPDGSLALGPLYQSVEVAGLTRTEAEGAVTKHLSKILRAPQVQITWAVPPGAGPGINSARVEAITYHFVLASSLAGGLLGLALSLREQRIRDG